MLPWHGLYIDKMQAVWIRSKLQICIQVIVLKIFIAFLNRFKVFMELNKIVEIILIRKYGMRVYNTRYIKVDVKLYNVVLLLLLRIFLLALSHGDVNVCRCEYKSAYCTLLYCILNDSLLFGIHFGKLFWLALSILSFHLFVHSPVD